MARQLTMQQIAERLGVSRMTVSAVINERHNARRVAPATRKRIVKFLDQSDYVPSRHAVNLRRPRRGAVGVLHTGRLYSHLIDAFNLMTDRFIETPDSVEIVVVAPNRVVDGMRELIARGVTNIVWINSGFEQSHSDVFRLVEQRNVVIYNYRPLDAEQHQRCLDSGVKSVGVDRQAGFAQLGRLLASLGHVSVCMPETRNDPDVLRHSATHMGLTEAGLNVVGSHPTDKAYIAHFQPTDVSVADGVFRAMRDHNVTAACFGDDAIAAHAIYYLQQRGVRVPDDLTVTSMDGMPWCKLLNPPLTTLAVPTERMVDMVERLLQGEETQQLCLYPMDLIERQTHGPAPSNPKKRGTV